MERNISGFSQAAPSRRMETTGIIPRGVVPPVVTVEEESNDDQEVDAFSEQSPEPSPLAPPAPQERFFAEVSSRPSGRSRQASSPGKPPSNFGSICVVSKSKLKNMDENLESEMFSNLPQAPSPHSPPPESLFSDAGEARIRRSSVPNQLPMREVRLQNSLENTFDDDELNISTSGTNGDESSSGVEISTQVRQRSSSSTLVSSLRRNQQQSNLLPALVQLKNDLQSSHLAILNLQEENKALSAQFENERNHWQEKQDQLLAKDREELEKKLVKEHQKALELLRNQLSSLNQEKAFLDEQLLALQNELDQSLRALEDQQSECHALLEDLKESSKELALQRQECQTLRDRERAILHRQEQELVAAKSSLQAEVDYWKRELSAAHQEYRDKLAQTVHSSHLRFEEQAHALEKANATIAELRAEKLALRQELVELKIRRTQTVDVALQTGDSLIEEEKLSSLHEVADHKIGVVAQTPFTRNNSRVSRVSTITEEIDDPHSEEKEPSLVESSATSFRADSSPEEVAQRDDTLDNNDTFQKELNAMKERHEAELCRLVRAHQQQEEQQITNNPPPSAEEDTRTLEERVRFQYEEQMRQVQQQHQQHLAEMKEQVTSEVVQAALRAVVFSLAMGAPTASGPPLATNSSTVVDRLAPSLLTSSLAKSSDVSLDGDRYNLMTSLREELTQSITEEVLRTVGKDGRSGEMTSSVSCQQLNVDRKSNVPSHLVTFSNIRNLEERKNLATYSEANALETNVEIRPKREQDLMMLQREWQEETNELLDSIQRECNQVFEKNRTQRARTSPRTVALADLSFFGGENMDDVVRYDIELPPEEEPLLQLAGEAKSKRVAAPAASYSPLHAFDGVELDRTLDETELLLRNLLSTH